LDQLSEEFLQSFRDAQQTSEQVQKLFTVRSELPVFSKKTELMNAIGEFPIILVKGQTGCGKTTQV